MWQNYEKDESVMPQELRKVKRTTVMEIGGKLTSADIKQRACIYYKLNALVYENCTTTTRIIDDHAGGS